jgi:hypothetical protein
VEIKTVGDLKKYLKELPDDLVVGGYDGGDNVDYTSVSFYINDRSKEKGWDANDTLLVEWWGKQAPIKVLVCSVD